MTGALFTLCRGMETWLEVKAGYGKTWTDLDRSGQTWTDPDGSRRLRLPGFETVVRSSTLYIGRLSPHFRQRLSLTQGRSAGGRIMSRKNS